MAKQRRGKVLKTEKNWRGTCPKCGRKRVKLAWTEGNQKDAIKICKYCYGTANRP